MNPSIINQKSDKKEKNIKSTNKFHVAVGLFRSGSQIISKCGKNKKVTHEAQLSVSLMF